MMQVRTRAYNLFLPVALLFLVGGFFLRDITFDIHLHDTYFVFTASFYAWLVAVIFLLLWALYLLTKNVLLSKWLTWAHVVMTILTLAYLCSFPFLSDETHNLPKSYSYNDFSNGQPGGRDMSVAIAVLLLAAAQLLYIINLAGGIARRMKK